MGGEGLQAHVAILEICSGVVDSAGPGALPSSAFLLPGTIPGPDAKTQCLREVTEQGVCLEKGWRRPGE